MKKTRILETAAAAAVITLVLVAAAAGLSSLAPEGSGISSAAEASAAEGGTESLPDIVERVSPSVVYITSKRVVASRFNHPMLDDPFWRRFFDVPREREEQTLGSGVIVGMEGYILTNNHLVGGASEVKVHSMDGREFEAAVIGTDESSDVAVLKIDGENLPTIPLGKSADLRLGETVIAIGYPFGIGQTVTRGIVSAQGRSLGLVQYEDFIQTDAAINPGNSGGALINERGELIGINTAIASRSGGSQGIGFAIPIDFARSIMNSLIDEGRVVRGYVGILPQAITRDMIDYFGLDGTDGVLVAQVVEDTPADRAGLERGDVIVEFNENDIKGVDQFRMLAAAAKPGDTVDVVILRDGDKKTIELEVGERPGSGQGRSVEEDAEEISPLFLGVGLQTLQDNHRQALEIPADVSGVIVTEVQSGTPAADAGLRRGDVIVEVDRKQIDGLEGFRRVMDDYKGDKVMIVVYRSGGYMYKVIRQ